MHMQGLELHDKILDEKFFASFFTFTAPEIERQLV